MIGSTLVFTFQASKILPLADTFFYTKKKVATFYFIVAEKGNQKKRRWNIRALELRGNLPSA